MEEWKSVVGYETLFKVSSEGRILSLRTDKILKQTILPTGYLTFVTRIGGRKGKAICLRVNILVAKAFVPNPLNKPDVNHIDGIKTNNRKSNLEWTTKRDNNLHAYSLGLAKPVVGVDNCQSKFTKEQVDYVRINYIPRCKEFGCRALGRKFNVSHTTISEIIRGVSYFV